MWPHQTKNICKRRASAKWKKQLLWKKHTHTKIANITEDIRKREPLCNLGRNAKIGTSHYENQHGDVFQKLKVEQMHDSVVPFSRIYLKEMIRILQGERKSGKIEERDT